MTWRVSESKRREGWLVVIGPYDVEFVAALKEAVPASLRSWEPVGRFWNVHGSCRAQVEQLIARFGS